ncbi:hypothetical protein [Pararhodonellum marinum]|uniref:hypothetical protein n=1 Tax=Pararhodonellum marinum TaxID=2755358 RepID=UPI0018907D4E|nr:hypothetical protein [Pararhodonellum marinum]
MAKKKNWIEKLEEDKAPQVKRLDKDFADMPAGCMMLIATPQIIDDYVKTIGFGKRIPLKTMREDLALEHRAEFTCPVTTGIFLRIVAEASYEKWQQGSPLESITPFWRVIDPNSSLAEKLSFGKEFLQEQLQKEMT